MIKIVIFALLMFVSLATANADDNANDDAVYIVQHDTNYGIAYALANSESMYLACYMSDAYNYYEFIIPPMGTSRYYLLRGKYKWQCWYI